MLNMAKARDIPGLQADMTFAQAAAATVAVRADEVFEYAGGVLDTDDIERVHDMRVATRRLRAVLEIYAPCFPKGALRPVLREVKALADALGARRDPDVLLARLHDMRAALTTADVLGVDAFADRARADQAEGNAVLARALAEAEESELPGRLAALAAAAAPPGGTARS
ncbi:MAG: exopolyphosphatase / guanosine-5-triphosphate,3-diphosphate pyrophosphatase [Solirubrobacteraceae bacterium]|jgi:CHAD domain-containing protein|nr:exopolyphosphatase / guanosine-5-triphosphate,3-diphosphate pyrophosphatase [Solirubrobacteraceae bacterium]